MSSFVHLHVHSNYSLLDGNVNFKRLFASLQTKGMTSVALTDHGVLYGAIPFYRLAKQVGIKPIIGCEVYVARNGHKDKRPRIDESPYHLVLLAENIEGYQNLMELVSIAHLDGFYYRPRIDKELLYEYRKGLIGLSACLAGEIPAFYLAGDEVKAREACREYSQILGKDNFFIEIQDQGLVEQKGLNEYLIKLAREENLALVASNDVHYLEQEDAEAHDVLLCMQTGKVLSDENRLRFSTDQFHLRSPEEMAEVFRTTPEALSNTVDIAARCELELNFNKFYLPNFTLTDGESPEERLEKECWAGLDRVKEITPEVKERLAYEIKVICEMGFAPYFLIVCDFIRFARERSIVVGPGRGSAAGSLVAYVLGITGLNPLEYGLIFERFLNPERVTMPDIDIDFCYERREEVIQYVGEKYGQDRVSQIITFGTMAARAALRDVGRVLDMPYGDVDKVVKDIPAVLGITLEEALGQSADLKEKYDNDPQVKRLLDLAIKLEGTPRHASTHAAGIVITPDKLTKYTPLQKTKDEITTQYEMGSLERIGLLKFDFLGLRTLTVIDHACQMITTRTGDQFNIEDIPLDDQKTYELLQTGRNLGVFQMESELYKRLTREYKPEIFEDIIAIIALGRPGPMGGDRLGDFIECRHGEKEVEYIHPLLEPILKETYGVILYQEQVMEIASSLGGFSMGEADILRRGMGKKDGDLILQYKEKFLENAQKKGLKLEQAEEIYNLMEFFGGYGFNKSHSAAYALICYQTGYLKANYPLELMAATMNSIKGNLEKVAIHMEECREMDIKVLPPDVNMSYLDFSITDDAIRFGLGAIKNVGENAIESIIAARQEEGEFISLLDFCQRVDLRSLNIRTLESLVKAGAFDSLGLKRSQLMSILEFTYAQAQGAQKAKIRGQMSLLDLMEDSDQYRQDTKVPPMEEFSKKVLLQMEYEVLGFYLSGHPLEQYRSYLKGKTSGDCTQLVGIADRKTISLGGIINKVTPHQTRKGKPMAFLTLEDWVGTADLVVFPDSYEKYRSLLKEGQAVIVRGQTDCQGEDDKGKILVSEMVPLEETLLLEISIDEVTSEFLRDLQEELSNCPQEIPIHLKLCRGQEGVVVALCNRYLGPRENEAQWNLQKNIQTRLKDL